MAVSAYSIFSSVSSIENYLTNIKVTAIANGWVLDADNIATTGELYIHSIGPYSNHLLYYSFKIHTATDDITKKYLAWHCNTGYAAGSAWDAQTGKFSVFPDYDGASGTYLWEPDVAYDENCMIAFWVVPTVVKQYVFANSQFIMFTHKITQTSHDGYTFSGWPMVFIGAADSTAPTTETSLNLTMSSNYAFNGYIGSILSPILKLPMQDTWNYSHSKFGYTRTPLGFLYDGKAMVDMPSANSIPQYGFLDDQTKFFFSSVPLISTYTAIDVGGNDPSYTTKDYRYTNTTMFGNGIQYWQKYLPNWAGALFKNTSSATITMVKPFIFNYEIDGVSDYVFPIRASLPYYATIMLPHNSPEDIVSIGARDFMIFPLFDVNDLFGIAIEV